MECVSTYCSLMPRLEIESERYNKWRKNVRKQKKTSYSNNLSSLLFMLNDNLKVSYINYFAAITIAQGPLLKIKEICQLMSELRVLKLDDMIYTPKSFTEIQACAICPKSFTLHFSGGAVQRGIVQDRRLLGHYKANCVDRLRGFFTER